MRTLRMLKVFAGLLCVTVMKGSVYALYFIPMWSSSLARNALLVHISCVTRTDILCCLFRVPVARDPSSPVREVPNACRKVSGQLLHAAEGVEALHHLCRPVPAPKHIALFGSTICRCGQPLNGGREQTAAGSIPCSQVCLRGRKAICR